MVKANIAVISPLEVNAANAGRESMKALSRIQFDILMADRRKKIVTLQDMEELFKLYGDEYYKDYGESPFELCVENPYWDSLRKVRSDIPRKGYKI